MERHGPRNGIRLQEVIRGRQWLPLALGLAGVVVLGRLVPKEILEPVYLSVLAVVLGVYSLTMSLRRAKGARWRLFLFMALWWAAVVLGIWILHLALRVPG